MSIIDFVPPRLFNGQRRDRTPLSSAI